MGSFMEVLSYVFQILTFKLVYFSYIYVTKFCKRINWRIGGLQFMSVRSGSVSLDS